MGIYKRLLLLVLSVSIYHETQSLNSLQQAHVSCEMFTFIRRRTRDVTLTTRPKGRQLRNKYIYRLQSRKIMWRGNVPGIRSTVINE